MAAPTTYCLLLITGVRGEVEMVIGELGAGCGASLPEGAPSCPYMVLPPHYSPVLAPLICSCYTFLTTLHPCTTSSRFYRSNHKGCSYSPSLHRSQPFLYRSLIDYEVSGTSYYSPLTDYLANTYPFPLNNLADNKGFFI